LLIIVENSQALGMADMEIVSGRPNELGTCEVDGVFEDFE
jgi:hypothetical protein